MQHIATLIVGRNMSQCCVCLGTLLRHVGCCWLKFENGQIFHAAYEDDQVCATMLRQGIRTSSIFNLQHVAVCRNRVTKRTQHVAPNNVVSKCCNRLAGPCKYWANKVAICCVELLRSFSWGLRLPYWPLVGNGYIQRTKPIKTASNK